VWDKSIEGEDDEEEGRQGSLSKLSAFLRSPKEGEPQSYFDKKSIAQLCEGGNEGAVEDLMRHPLAIMFSFIMSPNFIGLDIGLFQTVEAFKHCISIEFMAKVLYVMLRTGKIIEKIENSTCFFNILLYAFLLFIL
jgi:hypothetical protein